MVRLIALAVLPLVVFSLDPDVYEYQKGFFEGFLKGYQQGYYDAKSDCSNQVKLSLKACKDTQVLKWLKGEEKYAPYLSGYKLDCCREIYFFVPLKESDVPAVVETVRQKVLSIHPGYWVYVRLDAIPLPLGGYLEYLAKQRGYTPKRVGKYLLFYIAPTEAQAYDTKNELKKIFSEYLKGNIPISVEKVDRKSKDINILLTDENL